MYRRSYYGAFSAENVRSATGRTWRLTADHGENKNTAAGEVKYQARGDERQNTVLPAIRAQDCYSGLQPGGSVYDGSDAYFGFIGVSRTPGRSGHSQGLGPATWSANGYANSKRALRSADHRTRPSFQPSQVAWFSPGADTRSRPVGYGDKGTRTGRTYGTLRTLRRMPSIPAQAFRDEVAASLTAGAGDALDDVRDGGPESGEMQCALMLGGRAAREWAASAIAAIRLANRLEIVAQLGKPEDAEFELAPAVAGELQVSGTAEERAVLDALRGVTEAVSSLDTEASLAGNAEAFRAVGQAAAQVLVSSAVLLGGENFVVAQTNKTLAELVGLSG